MQQKIVRIEQSLFNRKYRLELDCGHEKWVSRKPRKNVTGCSECSQKHDNNSLHKEGTAFYLQAIK